MQRAHGTFKGTGAETTLGLGFQPDYVKIRNLTDLTELEYTFDDYTNRYGVTRAAAGDKAQAASAAYGIAPYAGGDLMSAASTVYLVRNEADQRNAYDVNAPISTFTIGSVANKTGNFDVEASTSYVGVGSRITFDGQSNVYWITAMTSNGESANEVTLNAVPSGKTVYTVSKIWSRWDFTGSAKGIVIPKGITIGASATVIDTDGDVCSFEAVSYSA